MSARLVLGIAVLALCSAASAGDPTPLRGALKGDYWVYGGALGDTVPPTKNDRKVALTFRGALAKELFDQIGPDNKNACGAAPDHRTRDRNDLSCVWDKRDGYTCYFGLDVSKGKSTYGSIC